MWRRYIPNTNWPSDAITRTNHSPCEGNETGSDARTPPALGRMLRKRTTSAGQGSVPNGSFICKRIRSRPSHRTTFASNGSLRSNAARNFARDRGLRTTKVPAAPTLTTSYSLSSRAKRLGWKVLCPPTLTPRRKTTRAMPALWIKWPISAMAAGCAVHRGFGTSLLPAASSPPGVVVDFHGSELDHDGVAHAGLVFAEIRAPTAGGHAC